jgi:hypothetical protein
MLQNKTVTHFKIKIKHTFMKIDEQVQQLLNLLQIEEKDYYVDEHRLLFHKKVYIPFGFNQEVAVSEINDQRTVTLKSKSVEIKLSVEDLLPDVIHGEFRLIYRAFALYITALTKKYRERRADRELCLKFVDARTFEITCEQHCVDEIRRLAKYIDRHTGAQMKYDDVELYDLLSVVLQRLGLSGFTHILTHFNQNLNS